MPPPFLFIGENASPHYTVTFSVLLQSKNIERMDRKVPGSKFNRARVGHHSLETIGNSSPVIINDSGAVIGATREMDSYLSIAYLQPRTQQGQMITVACSTLRCHHIHY